LKKNGLMDWWIIAEMDYWIDGLLDGWNYQASKTASIQ